MRPRPPLLPLLLPLLIAPCLLPQARAYTPTPRWAHASLLTPSFLYIHGGLLAPPGGTYNDTTAPLTSSLLLLPLSEHFTLSSPPWVEQDVGGPEVAWHTLTRLARPGEQGQGAQGQEKQGEALLFGGALPQLSNDSASAWLFSYPASPPSSSSAASSSTAAAAAAAASSSNTPLPGPLNFTHLPPNWAQEPARRYGHAACSSSTGELFLLAGLSPFSGEAFTTGLRFAPLPVSPPSGSGSGSGSGSSGNPGSSGPGSSSGPGTNSPQFTSFPTPFPGQFRPLLLPLQPNAPSFLYVPAPPLGLGSLWVMDVSLGVVEWLEVRVGVIPSQGSGSGSVKTKRQLPLPVSRHSSAACLTSQGLLVLQGGLTPSGEVLSDGWVLDTTLPEWAWESRPGLRGLGGRRDHSAVAVGGDGVLFLFGE
ncbi:hypothetical protein CALVIDRAFT_273829 [Calocera viscosa TUFC12733]|uniref:Galactose oxidase n=1 Tax=Calocera viscosa (strain TUFC12733) TaxID=1330018 RepID=A0A167QYU1_CALVF|nr:hypothetical protein CALVIDRAFT_273829 [Calocera viscosa TUFC12733]